MRHMLGFHLSGATLEFFFFGGPGEISRPLPEPDEAGRAAAPLGGSQATQKQPRPRDTSTLRRSRASLALDASQVEH